MAGTLNIRDHYSIGLLLGAQSNAVVIFDSMLLQLLRIARDFLQFAQRLIYLGSPKS